MEESFGVHLAGNGAETLLRDQGGVQGWILVLKAKPGEAEVVLFLFSLKALLLTAMEN